MEHKIILNCRVCLDDFDEAEMIDLFAEKKTSGAKESTVKLYAKLEYCCGVRIRESSEMPSKICLKCFDMTRIWYNFRQLCINSQIYLESLCKDRRHPKNADDSDYLEYLFEDLQIFRMKAQQENPHLDVNITQSGPENEYGSSDEYYEALQNGADESDVDVAQIVADIKKEPEEYFRETEKSQLEGFQQIPKKRSKSQNSTEGTPKKRYRLQSPSTYMCSICGNVYTKKTSFAYHMSIHSDARPHECELCGKSFRQTSELKNHMRRHTGERPYKCSYCDRHFIDRSEKHRHERIHTNTRPYVCKICGKSFMYSAILKNHTKLHSGEKNFNCVVCRKAFTLQHQLKAHLQTITHKQKESQSVGVDYDVVYE